MSIDAGEKAEKHGLQWSTKETRSKNYSARARGDEVDPEQTCECDGTDQLERKSYAASGGPTVTTYTTSDIRRLPPYRGS